MKKFLKHTLLFFLIVNSSKAQTNEQDPTEVGTYLKNIKQINFCGTYEAFQFPNTPLYHSVGLSIEGVFRNHLGFEILFSAGKDNLQTGIGSLMLPFYIAASALSKEDEDDLGKSLKKIFLSLAFFEHVNYHIILQNNFELVPYLSLARIRYMYAPDLDPVYPKSTAYISGSVGMKACLILKNNWLLSVYGEGSQLYIKNTYPGFQVGLNFGKRINWSE